MSAKVDRRRREIVSILQVNSIVYVNEIAKRFKVTKETIRNDFDQLVETFGFIRIHGGIKQKEGTYTETKYQFLDNKMVNIEEKKQICYRTLDLIHDGECIYVDSGSTVSYILNYLNQKRNITLVTPSIVIMMKYIMEDFEQVFDESGHKLIFVGGSVQSGILTTYGPFFDQMVDDFNFDAMIVSFDSIDMKKGCCNADEVTYSIVKKIMKQVKRRIVLADYSKFDKVKRYQTMKWLDVDYLVTDKELDENWKNELENHKVIYYKA